MIFFKDLFRDLVEKRLWPLALGLVVALVAVPVVLSKSGGERVAESPAPNPLIGSGSAALLGETKPAVSIGGDQGFRKHIGRFPRKNPFVQQAKPKPGTAETLTTPTTSTTATTGGGSTGATPVSTPTASAPGGGTRPAAPVKKFQYVATVLFGEIGKSKTRTVRTGDFLPSQSGAVVFSLGASADGRYALFLVSREVTARGDAECTPSESDCQILRMRKGDVEFLEVARSADTVATYELEVKSIDLKELPKSKTAQRQERFHLP